MRIVCQMFNNKSMISIKLVCYYGFSILVLQACINALKPSLHTAPISRLHKILTIFASNLRAAYINVVCLVSFNYPASVFSFWAINNYLRISSSLFGFILPQSNKAVCFFSSIKPCSTWHNN